EGVADHPLGSVPRDDGYGLRGGLGITGDGYVVLDAGVEPLGVLANEYDVNVIVASAGDDIPGRAHVGVEVEGLPEGDVDGAIATTHRRLERALQGEPGTLDGVEGGIRHGVVATRDRGRAGDLPVPLEAHTGGFQDSYGGVGDIGADA